MVKDFKALNLSIGLWIFPHCVILLTFGLNKYNLFRITDVFSFIICLDEKFRKRTSSEPYLAVMNAFLRKLNILSFTVKILHVSYPSYIFFMKFSKVFMFGFYAVMLAQCEVFFIFWACSLFPSKTGIKETLVAVKVGNNCPKIELEIIKDGFVDTFLLIFLLFYLQELFKGGPKL